MTTMRRRAVGTTPCTAAVRRCASVILVVLACRAEAPTARPTVVPATTTVTVDDAAFLRLDADLAAAYPWRGKLVRAAAVRLEHDGDPTGDASGRNLDLSVIVIDEDTRAAVQRPLVLCVHDDHRIAVRYDVDDLGLVARDGAMLTATPIARTRWPDDEPGVRLVAGTLVRSEGSRDGTFTPVAVDTPSVRARGYVDSRHVGTTYQAAAFATPDAILDAKVTRATVVFASPGAVELARLNPQMAPGGLGARRLGRTAPSGHALVAVPGVHTRVVGWIEQDALETGSVPSIGPRTIAPALAQVDGDREPSIALPAGTMLHGGALQNRVGVVTHAARFHCVDGCDGDEPTVLVAACTVAVPVVARAPR